MTYFFQKQLIDKIGLKKWKTLYRAIVIFQNKLNNRYIGNWKARENNSRIAKNSDIYPR